MKKSTFIRNSFLFYLLLAVLFHSLFLLIPTIRLSPSVSAEVPPLSITYTRVNPVQQSPGKNKSAFSSEPEEKPYIQTKPREADALTTMSRSDVKTAEIVDSPFTGELAAGPTAGPINAEENSDTQGLLDSNLPLWQELNRKLREAVIYPAVARKRGLEGLALVRFELDETGQLKQFQLVQSTGHDLLDKAVVAALHRIIPFKHGLGRSIRVQQPLRYQLEK